MKKSLVLMSIALFSVGLVACSNKGEDATKESTAVSSESSEEVAVFRGEISELPIIDGEYVVLTFDELEAIKDPDDMLNTFEASGLTLNADFDSFEGDVEPEDVVVGSVLEFTLTTPAAMTYSIPPQISGDSIISIKDVD